MQTKDWTKIWHNAQLDVRLLQAFYVDHAFPRHSHDYYVICLIKRGLQSFTHKGTKHFTPPGGVIFINPGAVQFVFRSRRDSHCPKCGKFRKAEL